jgi:hypothetical protein
MSMRLDPLSRILVNVYDDHLFVPAAGSGATQMRILAIRSAASDVAVCWLFACAFPAWAQSASNAFWQAQSIYQVITDRYYDGDTSNNNADGNYNPSGTTSVHGGDFKGLEQKLDYIKALGATAIWISPIVLNGHGQFHGYAARDFYHVDPDRKSVV